MLKKKALSLMIAWTLLVSSIALAPVSGAAEAAQDIYVMSYHTSGTSGTNMTYMDDSLHLAYSYDASHWTALGDNNGILFKKIRVIRRILQMACSIVTRSCSGSRTAALYCSRQSSPAREQRLTLEYSLGIRRICCIIRTNAQYS